MLNKILTQNTAIGLDGRKHRRNLNILCVGGSGSGKTFHFAKVNIVNANTSFIILDPKGEILRDTGYLLEEKGYKIKILDLINMEKSDCYNPFVYIRDDNDIQRLVTNIFKNTTPKGSQAQDPFWDQAASLLLKAIISLLHYEAPPEDQNFPMVLDMIRQGDVSEDDEAFRSPLDRLFDDLETQKPGHIAARYYRSYRKGAGKTLKSIHRFSFFLPCEPLFFPYDLLLPIMISLNLSVKFAQILYFQLWIYRFLPTLIAYHKMYFLNS